MVDKSRNPRRTGGGDKRERPARNAGTDRPGTRPNAKATGRPAGKPGTGPAASRTVAGVDRSTMELLDKQGLLTGEGRRALAEGGGTPRPPRQARFKPAVRGRAAQADEPKGERPAGRGGERGRARPEGRPAGRPAGGRTKLTEPEAEVAERLHKVMARAGVASRRHSEELIQAGRVTVNGKVIGELGTKIVPGRDIIEVDGRPLGKPEGLVYILMYKPKGYVTTLYDPQGRPKVTDLLEGEVAARVYPVGRLDYETEGLLLLTNDGDLANALMHPAREVKKTYIAKLRGVPGPAKIRALEEGIELEDGPTAPAEVKLIDAHGPNSATVSMRIHEGRNRQVRRMFETVGHEVIHLKRTTLGPLHLKDMVVGQWRELTERELNDLKGSVGMRVERMDRGAKVAAIVEKRKAGDRRNTGRNQAGAPGGREATPRGTRRPSRAKGPSPYGPGNEEVRPEGARFAGPRTDGARFDGPRPRNARADDARAGGGRADGARFDGPRPRNARADDARAGGGRADGAQLEGPRPRGGRGDDARPDGPRPRSVRGDDPRFDGHRPAGARPDGPRPRGARGDGARFDAPRPGGARTDGPNPRKARMDDDRDEGDRASAPRPAGARTAAPRPAGGRTTGGRTTGPRAPRGGAAGPKNPKRR